MRLERLYMLLFPLAFADRHQQQRRGFALLCHEMTTVHAICLFIASEASHRLARPERLLTGCLLLCLLDPSIPSTGSRTGRRIGDRNSSQSINEIFLDGIHTLRLVWSSKARNEFSLSTFLEKVDIGPAEPSALLSCRSRMVIFLRYRCVWQDQ